MNANQDRNLLHRRWLILARLGWLAFALLVTSVFVLGVRQSYREKSSLCTAEDQACWENFLLTESDLQELGLTRSSLPIYARVLLAQNILEALVCYSIAGLIIWRRSDEWLALLVALWILLIPGSGGIFNAASRAYPGLVIPVFYVVSLSWISGGLFLGLFPNGRFVPRWSMGYLLVWAIMFLLPPAVQDKVPDVVSGLAFFSFYLFAVIAPVYRYRKVSTPLERQQTKWLVFGASLAYGTAFLLLTVVRPSFPDLAEKSWWIILINWILGLFYLTLPISIGLAILRYRLWDIDVIIRRTLVYSIITVTLGLVYFGLVTVLQGIFSTVSGQSSTIAIVLSTLGIAALFTPLRRRIQNDIDRRFYRRKYDAEKALAAFNASLRDEVDLDQLSTGLVQIVRDTVQPEHVTLWLRTSPDQSLAHSWDEREKIATHIYGENMSEGE